MQFQRGRAMQKSTTPSFFESETEALAFNEAMTNIFRKIQDRFVQERLPEENMQRFTHGAGWASPANAEDVPSKMTQVSSGYEIPFEKIVEGDLSIIAKSIQRVSEDMNRQFMQMLYKTVSDACDRSGNVVDGKKAGSIPASFLEMIKKVALSVGRDGKVQMPEIHVSPELGKKMIAELESQPAEFREEVQKIQAEKTAQALQREEERKGRFKNFSV